MYIAEQFNLIKRGTVEIIHEEELKKRLREAKNANRTLIIKAGFDPTVPDIHLGHTVLLRKLRHFQQMGHKIIFLIGDATALIGDPSGQSKTRRTMTWEEVKRNASTYIKQVGKILDVKDKKTFELRRNSEWFSKRKFCFDKFVELAGRYTVARLIERDDFQMRLKSGKPISFLELFYPLMQGYDSVVLGSDVEIGGTDQKFNMIVGRNLQEVYGQKGQVIITVPLLEGTDGKEKMSKSLGNYIGIRENPKDIYGKIMSISDELMLRYYELLTDEPMDELENSLHSGKLHPKKAKMNLARAIVFQYYGEEEAKRQESNFEKMFREKVFPEDIPLKKIKILNEKFDIINCLSILAKCSKSETRRKLTEGAVEIDGKKIGDFSFSIQPNIEYKIRIGKRFFKVVFE